MSQVEAFPPIAENDARLLVLGSAPGIASLQADFYYAHPRNAFWPIMMELTGELIAAQSQPALNRARRQLLINNQVALWDVLASCQRPGSLDSAIVRGSEQVNDFGGFLLAHRSIEAIACNGQAAFKLFKSRVLGEIQFAKDLIVLPSTSPANARMTLAQKTDHWRRALSPWLPG
ncbi:MAG: DNA-deoxyinosine glycosylase [Lysobacteraceae bacterium]|nr:MAG: DNA-deoxyinosine glycosylase [Xanthomonadaceae bacterium]